MKSSAYSKTYTSYSGADIVATITPQGGKTIVVGELATISYSLHREVYPVNTLGRINAKGFCLPESARILTKDRGYLSVKDIKVGDYIQSSPLTFNKVSGKYDQPEKECLRITLRDGYEIDASYDHPIMTSDWWKNAMDINVGDKIFIASISPCPATEYPISDDILSMVAYLIGDGSIHTYTKPNGSIEYRISLSISNSEMSTIGRDVTEILGRLNIGYTDSDSDGCIDRRISVCTMGGGKTDWRQREYNDLHKTLLVFDLYGTYSHTKFIPPQLISGLSARQTSLFLNRLFSTDGCYCVSDDLRYIEAKYCSTSVVLAQDVRLMLSKLGICALMNVDHKVGRVGGRTDIVSKHDAHLVVISDCKNLLKFIKLVDIFGKEDRIAKHVPMLSRRVNTVVLPIEMKEFADIVRRILINRNDGKKSGIGLKKFISKYNLSNYNLSLTPRRAYMVADAIKDPDFSMFVEKIVNKAILRDDECIYKTVVRVDSIGCLPTFDLTVEEQESFISNFVLVHNTRGPRTIAGSLVFTVFDRHLVSTFVQQGFSGEPYSKFTDDDRQDMILNMKLDEMPPIDVTITMSNELGNQSTLRIYGVLFVDEGQVMSIEDVLTEQTVSYIASDIEMLRNTKDVGGV